MQQVKNIRKILLLLSFIVFFPLWQTSVFADESPHDVMEKSVAMININTASAKELSEGLNGVGLKRAERIVQYREAHGNFTSVEQLMAVKGIGEKVLEKNKPFIIVK